MLKWKSESCEIEKFALAYIKHDELVQNTFTNDKAKPHRAYAAIGKELGMPVGHVRRLETAFKRRYLEMMQRWLRTGAGLGARWVWAAEARLGLRARLVRRADGVVRALLAAARGAGALCSGAVYRRVARALRLRAALPRLHGVWVRVQLAALRLLAVAARAGDARAAAPPPAHAQLADLVLLHTDFAANRLLTEESEAIFSEELALRTLCELVRVHRAELRAPPARVCRVRAQRWSRVYRDYRKSQRVASVVVLQRRWHELKALSVRALRSYWRRTRAPAPPGPPCRAVDPHLPLPTPLQLKVLTEYPHIASGPLPRWRSLVRQGEVITSPLSDEEYEQENPPRGETLRRSRTSDDENDDPQKSKLDQNEGTDEQRASYFPSTPASMLASTPASMLANTDTPPDTEDFVSLLRTRAPHATQVSMDTDGHNLVIDEDAVDVKPEIDPATGEVIVKTEPGEPSWPSRSMADRIVFTDDDASSIEISDDSDYCDDFDEGNVSSDNNFDEKILYEPRVCLTRVEELPAWRRHARDGRRILARHWADPTAPHPPTARESGSTVTSGGATKRKEPSYYNLTAPGAGESENLSFYEEGPYPTLEEIREMVKELSVMRLSRDLRPAGGLFCCAARQQRHESDERQRAGLPPQHPLDKLLSLAHTDDLPAHLCGTGVGAEAEQCGCCCWELCPATSRARVCGALLQLQRSLSAMLPVRNWPREETAAHAQTLNEQLSAATSDTNKPKPKGKPRPKKRKSTDDETPSTTNDYDEWIRQKNVNKFYFTVPGTNSHNKNNSSKTNAKKENKKKPDKASPTQENALVSTTPLTTVTTPTITTTASSTPTGSIIAATPTPTIISTPTCLISSLNMSTRSVNIASKPVRLTPITAIYVPVPATRPEPATSNDEVICISDEETRIKEEPEEECSVCDETPTPQVASVPAPVASVPAQVASVPAHVASVPAQVATRPTLYQPLQSSSPILYNNVGTTSKYDHTYSSVRFQNNTLNQPFALRSMAPGTLTPVRLSIAPVPQPTSSAMVNNKPAPDLQQTVYFTMQPRTIPVNTHAATNVSEANVPHSIDKEAIVKGPVENDTNEQNQMDSPGVVNINVEKPDNVVLKTSVTFETEHGKANEPAASAVHISFTLRERNSQQVTSDHPTSNTELEKTGEQPTCPEPVVSAAPISQDTIQPVKNADSKECANNAKEQVDRVAAPRSTQDADKNGSDYAEWIRQKNINSQYFQMWPDLKKPASDIKSPKRNGTIGKKSPTVSETNKKTKEKASSHRAVKDKVPANKQVTDEIPFKPSDDTSLCTDAESQTHTIDARAQSELPLHGALLQSELAVHNAMVQNFSPTQGQSVNNDISFHSVPALRENPDSSEAAENKSLLQDATMPSERPSRDPVQYTANTNNTNNNDKDSSLTYPTNITDNNLTTLEGSPPDPKLNQATGQNPPNRNDTSHSNGPLYIDIPKNTDVLLPDFSEDEEELSPSTVSKNVKLLDTEQPRIPTLIVGKYPPERSYKLVSPKNSNKSTAQLSPFTLRMLELRDSANMYTSKRFSPVITNITGDDHTLFRQEASHKLTERSPIREGGIQTSPTVGSAHNMQDAIQSHNLDSPLEVRFVGEYPSRPATKKLTQCFDNISPCHIQTDLSKLVDRPTYEPPWRRSEPSPVSKTIPVVEVFGSYPTSNNKDSSKSLVPLTDSENFKTPKPDDLPENNNIKQMDEEVNLNVPAETAATPTNNNLPEDLTSPTARCESPNDHEAEFPPPVRRVQRRISDGIRKCSIFMVPSSSPGKNNIINVPETKNNLHLLDNEELEVESDCKELDPVRHIPPISPTDLTKQISAAPAKLVQRRHSYIQLGASDKDKPSLCSPKKLMEVPVIPDAIVAEVMETKPKLKNNLIDIIKKYTPVSLKSQAHRRYSLCCETSGDTKSKTMLLKEKLRTDWENNFFPTRKRRGRRKSMPSTTYPIRSSLASPILKVPSNKTDPISAAPPLKICERRSSLRINPWSGRNEMKDKSVIMRRNSTASEITSANHDHISGNAVSPKESKATLSQITPNISPKLNATNQKLFSPTVDKNDATISAKNIDQTATEETLPNTEIRNEKLPSPTIFPQPLKIIKKRNSQVHITPWSGANIKSVVSTEQEAERSTEVSAPEDTDTEVSTDAHAKNVHFKDTADEVSDKVPTVPKRRKSLCDTEHRFSPKIKEDSCRTLRTNSLERDEDLSSEASNRELNKNVVTVPLSSKLCKFIAAQKATRDKYYSPGSSAPGMPEESSDELLAEPSSPSHHRRSELVITIPDDDYDKKDSRKLEPTTTIADLLLAPSNTTTVEMTKANDPSLLHSPKKRSRKRKKSRNSLSPVSDDVTPSKVKRSKSKHRLLASEATEDTKQDCVKVAEQDLSSECADESEDEVGELKGKHLTRKEKKELSRKIKLVTSAIMDLEKRQEKAHNKKKTSKRKGTHKKKKEKHRKHKRNTSPEHKETNNNNIVEQKEIKNIDIVRNTDITTREFISTDLSNTLQHKEIYESDKLKYKNTGDSNKLENKETESTGTPEHKDIDGSHNLPHKELNNGEPVHENIAGSKQLKLNDSNVTAKREHGDNYEIKHNETNANDKPEQNNAENSDKVEHKQASDSDKFGDKGTANSDKVKEIDDVDKIEHKVTDVKQKLEHNETDDTVKLEQNENDNNDKKQTNVDKTPEHKEVEDVKNLNHEENNALDNCDRVITDGKHVSTKLKRKDTIDSDILKYIDNCDSDIAENIENYDSELLQYIENYQSDTDDDIAELDTDVKEFDTDIEGYDSDILQYIEDYKSDVTDSNDAGDTERTDRRETSEADVRGQNNSDALEHKETNNNDLAEHQHSNIEKKNHRIEKEANNNVLAEQTEPTTEVSSCVNDQEINRIENNNEIVQNIDIPECRDSQEVTEHKEINSSVADRESDPTVSGSDDHDQQAPDVDCTELTLCVPAHVRSIPLPPVTEIPLPSAPAACLPGDIPLPSTPPPSPARYYSPTTQAGIVPKKRTYLKLYGELTFEFGK